MSNCRGGVVFSLLLSCVAGCGGGQPFSVAPVSGTVRCNGTPLKEGLVVFVPVGKADGKAKETGRSASGLIQPDGTYQLTTYDAGDGAIVGPHTVQVLAPDPVDDDSPLTDANRFACGNAPLQKTVTTGKNVLDLELSFAPAAGRR